MTSKSNIYVTRPFLPPLAEFIPYLEKIWENQILTNAGPLHQQLERELSEYLGVPYISLMNNATNALLIALKALEISGEVITTPYSFVATTNSIVWNESVPVFVDIDPRTLNLDADQIEAAITPRTTAIMPVHCYGNPCDVDKIQKLADAHHLKVIYDAAHAFGVKDGRGSILNYGDLSVLSFHATKVFNTFEGGAVICHDANTKQKIDQLRNFGIVDEVTVTAPGMNGKMSEVNAAFGLLQLNYLDQTINSRQAIDAFYREQIAGIKGIECLGLPENISANYGYFPILVQADYPLSRDALYQKLKDKNIYARRYFYPLISDFPMYRGLPSAAPEHLPVATDVAQKILCLPIYPALSTDDQKRIIDVLSAPGN